MAVWMQALAQGAGGYRIAGEIGEGVPGDNLAQAVQEAIDIPIVEEEAGSAMSHGVGEAADARGNDGDPAKDALGRDEPEGFRHEGRRDGAPGVREPIVEALGGLPAFEVDPGFDGKLSAQLLEGATLGAVADDAEPGFGLGCVQPCEGREEGCDTLLRFQATQVDEKRVRCGAASEAVGRLADGVRLQFCNDSMLLECGLDMARVDDAVAGPSEGRI